MSHRRYSENVLGLPADASYLLALAYCYSGCRPPAMAHLFSPRLLAVALYVCWALDPCLWSCPSWTLQSPGVQDPGKASQPPGVPDSGEVDRGHSAPWVPDSGEAPLVPHSSLMVPDHYRALCRVPVRCPYGLHATIQCSNFNLNAMQIQKNASNKISPTVGLCYPSSPVSAVAPCCMTLYSLLYLLFLLVRNILRKSTIHLCYRQTKFFTNKLLLSLNATFNAYPHLFCCNATTEGGNNHSLFAPGVQTTCSK